MNNNFKKILEPIYLKLDEYFSKNEVEKIKKLEAEKENLTEQLIQETAVKNSFKKEVISLEKTMGAANDKITLLEKEIKVYQPPFDVQAKINYYDNKYPIQSLTHAGRPIVTKNKTYKPKVFLPDYIFDLASMNEALKKSGLTLEQYLKKYDEYNTAVDMLRYDIYNYLLRARKYMYDKDLFGTSEFWSGPFISWYLKLNGIRRMDCEDSSLLLMSLFKAAGVPRGIQRCYAGKTYSGYGHAAVTVYSLRYNKWQHYESTGKGIYDIDEEKGIVIKEVWFSFDWKYAWTTDPKNLGKYLKSTKVSIK